MARLATQPKKQSAASRRADNPEPTSASESWRQAGIRDVFIPFCQDLVDACDVASDMSAERAVDKLAKYLDKISGNKPLALMVLSLLAGNHTTKLTDVYDHYSRDRTALLTRIETNMEEILFENGGYTVALDILNTQRELNNLLDRFRNGPNQDADYPAFHHLRKKTDALELKIARFASIMIYGDRHVQTPTVGIAVQSILHGEGITPEPTQP